MRTAIGISGIAFVFWLGAGDGVRALQDRAIGTSGGQTRLTPYRTLEGHSLRVRCLAYSPMGVLATGGQDRRICLWADDGRRLVRREVIQPGAGRL